MSAYQEKLLQLILETPGVIDTQPFTLVDGRESTYKLMFDRFNTGDLLGHVAECYADHLLHLGIARNHLAILHGIPEKGRDIATATSTALGRKGVSVRFCSLRLKEKTHGLPDDASLLDRWVVERNLKEGDSVYFIDDVIVGARSKIMRHNRFKGLGHFTYPFAIVGVDREEITSEGMSGAQHYAHETRSTLSSILRITDVYAGARAANKTVAADAIAAQLQKYGTEEAKAKIGN